MLNQEGPKTLLTLPLPLPLPHAMPVDLSIVFLKSSFEASGSLRAKWEVQGTAETERYREVHSCCHGAVADPWANLRTGQKGQQSWLP